MTCKIIGTIRDSVGVGITGLLTVKLNAPLIDRTTTPDSVRYGKAIVYEITLGDLLLPKIGGVTQTAGIVLLPTIAPDTTYSFDFTYEVETREFYLAGVLYTGDYHLWTDSNYWTGAIHSGSSVLLTVFFRESQVPLFETINAHIPNLTQVEWADLQHSSVNFSNIDTAIYYIAQLVSTGTNLINLVDAIYNPAGVWSAGVQYKVGDVVYYTPNKGSYWYINQVPSTGNLPTNVTYWQKVLESVEVAGGAIDTSQFLLNTAFSAAWNGVIDKAPVADRVYDQLISYGQLADSTFIILKAPTKTLGTNTTDVATTEFVQSALTAFVAPPATTAVNVEPADSTNKIVNWASYKRANKRYAKVTEEKPSGDPGGVGSSTFNRFLEFTRYNNPINTAGTINMVTTIPPYVQINTAGKYRFRAKACCSGVGQTRINLVVNGVVIVYGDSNDCAFPGLAADALPNVWCMVEGEFTGSEADSIAIQHKMQTAGLTTNKGKPSSRGGNEVYAVLELWLLS